jgi:hypothetical protein
VTFWGYLPPMSIRRSVRCDKFYFKGSPAARNKEEGLG